MSTVYSRYNKLWFQLSTLDDRANHGEANLGHRGLT
jgi:hypothetical protein